MPPLVCIDYRVRTSLNMFCAYHLSVRCDGHGVSVSTGQCEQQAVDALEFAARRGRLAAALREGVLAHLDAALCRRYRVRGVGAAAALDAVLPGGAAGGAAGVDARCDVGCDLIGELVVRP